MLNLILLALVALYIGFKLYKVLGDTKYDNEMSDENRKAYEDFKRSLMKDIELHAEKSGAAPVTSAVENSLSSDMKDVVKQIKSSQPDFTVENFTAGAGYAFQSILEAYADGDESTLKKLASPELCNVFMDDFNHIAANGQKRNITIVSVQGVEMSDISIEDNTASIEVDISSEQITNITDKVSGDIISGSLTKVLQCKDTWVFEKPINSKSKIWMLVQN